MYAVAGLGSNRTIRMSVRAKFGRENWGESLSKKSLRYFRPIIFGVKMRKKFGPLPTQAI